MAVLIRCRVCGASKERAEFYAHEIRKDGETGCCKVCTRARVAAYREANIERVRAYDRQRGQLEHRRAGNRARAHRYNRNAAPWREDHPDKYRAHNAVNNALRDGKLTKPTLCEGCGEGKPLEGHHDDYSSPLDVRWLCRQCHGAHHRALNAMMRGAA